MAATATQNSPKRRPKIDDNKTVRRKKVTKGYKQRHSIGSRKTKVVTYSESYPIYESLLAVYLEQSRRAKKKRSFILEQSKKANAQLPSQNTNDRNSITATSSSTDNTNTQTDFMVAAGNSMVKGKSKGAKPCISSKVKNTSTTTSVKTGKVKPLKDLPVNKKLSPKKEKCSQKKTDKDDLTEKKLKVKNEKKDGNKATKVKKIENGDKVKKPRKKKESPINLNTLNTSSEMKGSLECSTHNFDLTLPVVNIADIINIKREQSKKPKKFKLLGNECVKLPNKLKEFHNECNKTPKKAKDLENRCTKAPKNMQSLEGQCVKTPKKLKELDCSSTKASEKPIKCVKSPKKSKNDTDKNKAQKKTKSPLGKLKDPKHISTDKNDERKTSPAKKRKHDQILNKSKEKTPIKAKKPKLDKTAGNKKKDTKQPKKLSEKQKLKLKQIKADKERLKTDNMTKSLLDIFSLVRMKREASLNASARVNIMFEKLPPSPKTKSETNSISSPNKTAVEPLDKNTGTAIDVSLINTNLDSKTKLKKSPVVKVENKKSPKKDQKSKSLIDKTTKTKKITNNKKCPKVKKLPCDKKILKDKKAAKDKKSEAKKKEKLKVKKKDKVKTVSPIQGCVRRMASLNAQAIMQATKELETEASERAARIDRYCVAWQCEPLTAKLSSAAAAHWVDGLGKTCCVTQTSTCFTTATKPSVTPETPKLLAITSPEGDAIEERPASVVDVTTHVTPNPFLPLPPPQQCIGSFFSQSHSCVPPCSGCCGNDAFMSTSQFKSFQLGPLNSLNSLQMMTYGHPGHPYRSAFSVPYNHNGLPHYGYYSNSYYQPTTGPVIQTADPCIVSHHVSVPQPQVKVLIHNPESNLDHCAFPESTVKGSIEDEIIQPVVKRRCSSETKSKIIDKPKADQLKPKRKYERKRSKSPCKEEPEKKAAKVVKTASIEKPVIPAHGWSASGEPEWKKIPNVTEGPIRHCKCYPAMKHVDGDVINVRDCVLLRSGPRIKDIPFVAKVSALWENPEDGEIMMSLLWYYRPEHTEAGRKPQHLDIEVFACKHRDENSVACIDDKGYVLTYNEYCRFKAEQRRIESHQPTRQNVVPNLENNSFKRQRMPPLNVNPDNVFLCRQVYDFRQHRILKNPS